MGKSHSFDICSKVDLQELTNALNQADREVQTRYDLKDTKSTLEYREKEKDILIESVGDYQCKAILEIFKQKCIKRNISLKALKEQDIEKSGSVVKQIIKLQQGIEKEQAKTIIKIIKETKLKVQAQIQDDQIRVMGPKIDDLQSTMKLVKSKDLDFDMQFLNFR